MEQLRYNGPARIGIRPGNHFEFTLPLSGCKSLTMYEAGEFPEIKFEESKRCISGCHGTAGKCTLCFLAEGFDGEITFEVELVFGDEIALTPPMGWNSWYCFSESVSDDKIREAAGAMVERGLAHHGWNFICVDDCWQGERRGKAGSLLGNERFPDMAGLVAYIHCLGLKFGIYSTPWISSYAGFRGGTTDFVLGKAAALPPEERLQPHQIYGRYPGGEERNAFRLGDCWNLDADFRQWAEWGVDLVKMDWFPNDVLTTRRIAEGLRRCGRDIILSLSNNAPLESAEKLAALAQMWRITGDIKDSWESVSRIGFELSTPWLGCCSPGHWNDLDMLQIGDLGIPNAFNTEYRPTRLTREEQRAQLTLWCILSSPLILSCNLVEMDEWTYSLLTNDSVLAVNQDPLGAPATVSVPTKGIRCYQKPLADGSTVLAVFNLTDREWKFNIVAQIGRECRISDLWHEGVWDKVIYPIPPHGCGMFRLEDV